MVYYFHVGKLKSADGDVVEHPEAWYTVQRVWKTRDFPPFFVAQAFTPGIEEALSIPFLSTPRSP